jgi:hypothetical protein
MYPRFLAVATISESIAGGLGLAVVIFQQEKHPHQWE